jgi:hypothetical protein
MSPFARCLTADSTLCWPSNWTAVYLTSPRLSKHLPWQRGARSHAENEGQGGGGAWQLGLSGKGGCACQVRDETSQNTLCRERRSSRIQQA